MQSQEVNDDIYPFKTLCFIKARFGGQWVTGSGVIVGNNDVLTASHILFDNAFSNYTQL